MADQPQQQQQRPTEGLKSMLPQNRPSNTQILAVVTLLPVGGVLLGLAGITLVGTLIGLAVATPVFVIFSPVLVPAALGLVLALAGFCTSGAFGITALSSLSWLVNFLRQARTQVPEQIELAKKRAQEAAAQVGQRAREAGQKA